MKTSLRACALFAALFAGSACADKAPVSPEVPARAPQHGVVSGLLQLPVLQRLVPLSATYSAGATIGSAGGTLRIPEAGVTVTFPSGAVAAPTFISVTAPAGKNVAYQFEPHGITFQKAVVVAQDLGLTQVAGDLVEASSLEGAYFAGDAQLGDGTAQVQEEISASVDLLRLRVTFPIRHFSGYAIASSRGGYITSTGTRIPVDHTSR